MKAVRAGSGCDKTEYGARQPWVKAGQGWDTGAAGALLSLLSALSQAKMWHSAGKLPAQLPVINSLHRYCLMNAENLAFFPFSTDSVGL